MAGRKTVPTQIKIATGNPGKRALNKNEPGRSVGIEVPIQLIDDAVAADAYVELATLLTRINMMNDTFRWIVIDVAKLDSWILAIESALRPNRGWSIGRNGGIVVDQRAYLLASLKDQRRKAMESLGLSPVTMAKLFSLTPGAATFIGKGYAEQALKKIDAVENKVDDWQPPIGVTG